MSDKPIPVAIAADVEAARASVHAAIDGWVRLGFADAGCGADGSLVVWFEARRPFSAAEPLVATRQAGSEGWSGGFGSESAQEREIDVLFEGAEVACPCA